MTTDVPQQPSASASGGLWFVFPQGDDRFALWISPAGHGRIFVNGELQAEKRWLRDAWRHRFDRAGVPFEIDLTVKSTLHAECECRLVRDGEIVATLASAHLRPRSFRATLVYVASGIGLGVIHDRLDLALWQLAALAVAVLYLGRRLGPGGGYVIGTPTRVAAAKHEQRWRAGRSVPRCLRWLPRAWRNVRAGGRLAFGRAVSARDFKATLGQVMALPLLLFGLGACAEFLRVEPPRVLVEWALMRHASLYLLFFALVAGLVIWFEVRGRAVLLFVALLAAGVWSGVALLLAIHIAESLAAGNGVAWGYGVLGALAAWSLFYTGRALRLTRSVTWRRLAAPVTVYVAISSGASLVVPEVPLWYTDYEQQADAGSEWTPVDVERAYYRQRPLLDASLASLAPQTPGESDVFFVGFAPYAAQDLFMKEVEFVRRTVAQRFGSASRSLLLVNHLETLDTLAMANPSNLAIVLEEVGRRMDVAEDVLFLYLTSHGSADASLSVDFAQVMPNPLDAARLRALLDDSGIRWRVVVISACFSGSFIDALRDEQTLVLTAAHAEKTSFGCSNDRELTYFAEHLFAKEWTPGEPLLAAFEAARKSLERRERAEGFEYSDPQSFIGARMAEKLARLESRASRTRPGAPTPQGVTRASAPGTAATR